MPYCCDTDNSFLFPEQYKIGKVTFLAEYGPVDPVDVVDAVGVADVADPVGVVDARDTVGMADVVDEVGAVDVVDAEGVEMADAVGAADARRWWAQRTCGGGGRGQRERGYGKDV